MGLRQVNLLQVEDIFEVAHTLGMTAQQTIDCLAQDGLLPTDDVRVKDCAQADFNATSVMSQATKTLMQKVFYTYDICRFCLV